MADYSASDYTEIYHVSSTAEAQRILDVILAPAGVEGVAHNRQSGALPAASSQAGAVFIAVPVPQMESARKALTEAKESGYLEDGGFVEMPS